MSLRLEPVSADSLISEQIIHIWQQVFEKRLIHEDDDFFALGGDAALASELFRRLSSRLDRELHPALIFQARTPVSQALLLNNFVKPRIPVVIPLKPGAGCTPVFLLHGIGGSVLEFLELAKHLEVDLPIYALQATGTDGIETPLPSIEQMAAAFTREIQKRQPHGPYFLIGHSLGGLVTLEMARQLSTQGERIGLLTMIDAYPDKSQLPVRQRLHLNLSLLRKHLKYASNLPFHEALNYALHSSVRAKHRRYGSDQSSSPAAKRLLYAGFQALRNYSPTRYDGPVRFVGASIPTDFPTNPRIVWQPLLPKCELQNAPGDHHEMLSVHACALAEILTAYLKEALSNLRQ
jgi:acetoacetyl-CoA synthetase